MSSPIINKEKEYRTWFDDSQPPERKFWKIEPLPEFRPGDPLTVMESKWVHDGEIYVPSAPALYRGQLPYTDAIITVPGGQDWTKQKIEMAVPLPELVRAFGSPAVVRFSVEINTLNKGLKVGPDGGFNIDVGDLFFGAVVLPATRLYQNAYIRRYLIWIAGVVVARAPHYNIKVKWTPYWDVYANSNVKATFMHSTTVFPQNVAPAHSVTTDEVLRARLVGHLARLEAERAEREFHLRFGPHGGLEGWDVVC